MSVTTKVAFAGTCFYFSAMVMIGLHTAWAGVPTGLLFLTFWVQSFDLWDALAGRKA